ncbi:MAG: protein-L-isoaspartate(D-aspartate) O-methyltransferase [Proteobacteria bacterium]|nr:protein-L-isoaspartate(D-aspartate) O-methyltransferase [Pseudomonadota bacterium]
MVVTIQELARQTAGAIENDPIDPEVLQTMRVVPRHEFVPEDMRPFAYENRPLPIGSGQTISQPFIVAVMTDLLDLESDDKVLEIGTGSGYQAAILASLVDEVFTIEIVPELGERARATLERLGFTNVQTRIGDGYRGWPEEAPFDAIIVTAAPDQIPPPLVEQLKAGGRMIIPVGGNSAAEQLTLLEKQMDGSIASRQVMPVRFVPFTRDGRE